MACCAGYCRIGRWSLVAHGRAAVDIHAVHVADIVVAAGYAANIVVRRPWASAKNLPRGWRAGDAVDRNISIARRADADLELAIWGINRGKSIEGKDSSFGTDG